jgi:tRNA 5-methylaminomethyl-2-thiouridine biosynthesis bifunctional protein
MCDAPVAALERVGGGWILRAPDARALMKADAVVLACGPALTTFAAAKFLPLKLSRGQIEWGAGLAPAHAMAAASYVAPYRGGVLFGATFDDAADLSASPDARSQARNLQALQALAPNVAASLNPADLRSRAALRASTPDHAPIVGELPDAQAWLAANADAAHGAAPKHQPRHDGVFVLGGLGARGFTLAPLLGECLAGEICGEPALLSTAAAAAMHPARFLARAIKRRT